MCSTPSIPKAEPVKTETIAAPTAADAAVSKASTNSRTKAAALSTKNISTTARGLLDDNAPTKKKGLLGE